jgi:hypothetical protein
MLFVAPGLAVGSKHLGCRLSEGGDALRLAALEDGIEAHLDPGAYLSRTFARQRERHLGRAAQAEVAPVAIFLDAAHPAFGAAGLHDQEEAVTIAQAAGSGGRLHCGRREPSHRPNLPHFFPHAKSVGDGWGRMRKDANRA